MTCSEGAAFARRRDSVSSLLRMLSYKAHYGRAQGAQRIGSFGAGRARLFVDAHLVSDRNVRVLCEQRRYSLLPIRAVVEAGLPANHRATALRARRAPTNALKYPCRAHPLTTGLLWGPTLWATGMSVPVFL